MKKFLLSIAFVFVTGVMVAQEKPNKEDVLQVIEKSGASGQLNAAKKQLLSMIPSAKHAAKQMTLLQKSIWLNILKKTSKQC